MDAKLEAKKIVRATWHGGPNGLQRTIDDVATAIADARAAGYAEAIEKAAKVAEDVSVKLHEDRHEGGYGYNDSLKMSDGAEMAADAIRALAPAATTEEPK